MTRRNRSRKPSSFVTAILVALAAVVILFAAAKMAKAATFRHDGPAVLNDLAVTPGATGTMMRAQLCDPNFHTGTVRNVTEAMKQQVCTAYGIARADCTGKKYEIDHLISLELGGSNDLKNLWPQPYFPKPGAKEKDTVENWLHRQVCAKQNPMPLTDAQHAISTDWYQIFLKINIPVTKAPAK